MTATMIFGTGWEMGLAPEKPNCLEFVGAAARTTPKTGSYSLRFEADTNSFKLYINHASGLNLTLDEIYISLWIKPCSTTAHKIYIYLTDGNYLGLRRNYTNNTWDAYVNTNLVDSGAVVRVANIWQHIQLHIKVADAGTIETKIDGIADVDYSGDTQPGATSTISCFYMTDMRTSLVYSYLDDLVLGTGGWLGDVRFDVLTPDADTADSDWTASTGSDKFALINEIPPSDANYIYTETNGQQNISGISNWVSTNKTPLAIVHWIRANKDPENTQQVKILESLNATQSVGAANDLGATVYPFYKLSLLDPEGNAWIDTNINALLAGVEAVI